MPNINVELPDELHAKLVAAARAARRSLKQQIIHTLDMYMAGRVESLISPAELQQLRELRERQPGLLDQLVDESSTSKPPERSAGA